MIVRLLKGLVDLMFSEHDSWLTVLAGGVDFCEFLGVLFYDVTRGYSSDLFFHLLCNGLGDSANCKPSFQAILQFRFHQYVSLQSIEDFARHSLKMTSLWGQQDSALALQCFLP